MANEISVGCSIRFRNGYLVDDWQAQFNQTQTSVYSGGGVQNVGTAAETLAVPGDVTTAGWGYVRNLHTANYIDIGLNTTAFSAVVRLYPGEGHPMAWGNTAIAVRAQTSGSTAVVPLQWKMSDR